MTWSLHHKQSEIFAGQAEIALKHGEIVRARTLYAQAAEAEELALHQLDNSKKRTVGISAVSTASLWYKAKEFQKAEKTAYRWLGSESLPEFASTQLREILQIIWSQLEKENAEIDFSPEQVIVSVKGGQIIRGGPP
ncbi:MAG: hypothetical protein GY862_33850 [Gammaproteobacteria bacterium]|nr:hypothetical protein [Gammaproteobacteria bacterium]